MKAFITIFLMLVIKSVQAQVLVVDPAVSGAIVADGTLINGQLNTTNNRLDLIQKGQMAVSGQLVLVNNLQNRIYQGLSQVASVINNLSTIKEIADCGIDIVKDVQSAVTMAKSNPVLLLFAERGARDFQTRATALATDVSAFVLRGGTQNLMDSGERGKLLNHIASEMHILGGLAYGMNRCIYWAKINGILRSLNPWGEWQNQDVRIANEVLTNARYLKP